MESQMKRGLLDYCVLAILSGGESYGYAIVIALRDAIPTSESTLYPILRRLEKAGQLTVREEPTGGRLRKYYAITEAGQKKLEDFKYELSELMEVYNFIYRESKTASKE